jgi:hypothetical protein
MGEKREGYRAALVGDARAGMFRGNERSRKALADAATVVLIRNAFRIQHRKTATLPGKVGSPTWRVIQEEQFAR